MMISRTTIRCAQAALVGCLLVSFVHSASAGGGLSVPKQLQKAATERKAELSKLKVGLGPFRHFSQAKLTDVGVSNYVPVGESVIYDFSTAIPPGWQPNSANGVGSELIEKDKVGMFWMRVPADRWDQFRQASASYSFQARVKRVASASYSFPGEEEAIWGVYLDNTDRGYYFLVVKRAGQAKLFKKDGKQLDSLADWVEIPGGLAHGDWNTFKIERQGDKLLGFVNGQQVAAATDSALPRGIAGVYFANLGKVEIDDVVIQNLELSQEEVAVGSGYDYTEEVLEGLVKSGLFLPAQIGISNNPAMESWDYLIGADTMDSGLGYYILREGNPKPAQARVSLPAEGNRAKSMTQFGEYLAYELAGKALGISGEGKP